MSRIEKILQAMIDETSYDKAPQSRIEAILLAIKNNTQYSHLPHSRIEEILLAIKNNTSYDKEPMSRIEEILLAKLNSVEYKKPVQSKIEKLLLKWFYQDLYLTLKGVPPLTFTTNGQPLVDWTIYGNTINDESVGDRTGNLFDGEIEQGSFNGTTGAEVSSDIRVRTTPLTITPNTFTINANGVDKVILLVYDGDTYLPNESVTDFKALPYHHTFSNNRTVRFAFGKNDNSTITTSDISNIMLNSGSEPLPYEPCGYRVPVTVSNGADTQTTNLYLPEQIRKVRDEAEYIDFGEQKQHRVRKNLANNNRLISNMYTVSESNNYLHVVGTNTSSEINAIIISRTVELEPGVYDLVNNSSALLNFDYKDENNNTKWANTPANSIATFTYPSNVKRGLNVYKAVAAGSSVDDYFQVMIVKHGNDTTIYEPYITNTELDVTLPALPTLSGTNTLSVGTEVQPSNMEIIYAPNEPELRLMMKKIEVMKNEQRT